MSKSFNYSVELWNAKGKACKTQFAAIRQARLYAESMSVTGKFMAYVSELRSGMEIGIYANGKDVMVHDGGAK